MYWSSSNKTIEVLINVKIFCTKLFCTLWVLVCDSKSCVASNVFVNIHNCCQHKFELIKSISELEDLYSHNIRNYLRKIKTHFVLDHINHYLPIYALMMSGSGRSGSIRVTSASISTVVIWRWSSAICSWHWSAMCIVRLTTTWINTVITSTGP